MLSAVSPVADANLDVGNATALQQLDLPANVNVAPRTCASAKDALLSLRTCDQEQEQVLSMDNTVTSFGGKQQGAKGRTMMNKGRKANTLSPAPEKPAARSSVPVRQGYACRP